MSNREPSPQEQIVEPLNRRRRVLDKIARRVPIRAQWIALCVLFAAWFVFAASRILELTPFGLDPRKPYAAITLAGLVCFLVFGPGLWSDSLARHQERRRRDEEYEKAYVSDPEEEDRIRRQLGMSPNKALERSRDG